MPYLTKLAATLLILTTVLSLTSCKKEATAADVPAKATTTTVITEASTTTKKTTSATATTTTLQPTTVTTVATTVVTAAAPVTTAAPTASPTVATTPSTTPTPAPTTPPTSAPTSANTDVKYTLNGKTYCVPAGKDPVDYTMKQARVDVARPNKAIEEELHSLVNAERQARGLQPLVFNEDAYHFVQTRAAECLSSFSHTRPNGTPWHSIYCDVYFVGSMAENLAGTTLPHFDTQNCVESWMNSETHRMNILDTSVLSATLSVMIDGDRIYIAQHFFTYIPS